MGYHLSGGGRGPPGRGLVATVTDAVREGALSPPEQFFAVEGLLRSAANAKHVAERAEMWDLGPAVAETLTKTAQADEDAATVLLTLLCPTPQAFSDSWAFLTGQVAV